MKNLLRILTLAIISMIFIPLLPVQAASPEIYITVNNGVNPGEYEATVSVIGNPGIAGYNLGIGFDPAVLTPISIRQGEAFTSGMIFISNITGASEETIAGLDVITAVWGSARDDSSEGILYTVMFRADPYATGQTELALYSRGTSNTDSVQVDFVLSGATIVFSSNNNIQLIMMIVGAILLAILIIVMYRKRKKKIETLEAALKEALELAQQNNVAASNSSIEIN